MKPLSAKQIKEADAVLAVVEPLLPGNWKVGRKAKSAAILVVQKTPLCEIGVQFKEAQGGTWEYRGVYRRRDQGKYKLGEKLTNAAAAMEEAAALVLLPLNSTIDALRAIVG